MRTRTTVVLAFFRFLQERKIRYCVVGDVSGFPHVVRSDVDIVVDETFTAAVAHTVCDFCDKNDLQLVQCLEHEQNARYFVVGWRNADDNYDFLALDICGDYYRNGRKLLSSLDLLATRQVALDSKARQLGFYVPSPAMGFIYYLLKRIDKAALNDQQTNYLYERWQRNPSAAANHIRSLWGNTPEARLLIQASEVNDWSVVRCILPRLRRVMRKQRPMTLRSWYCEMQRRARRVLKPSGVMIAFLGPDGSGKSSLLPIVADQVEPLFRRQANCHLRPRMLLNKRSQGPVTAPHAQPPRGAISSIVKLALLVGDYALGYVFKIRPALVRSTLVIFDRYYDDIAIDPRRYRFGAAARWLQAFKAFVPKPDLYVVLDAPIELLRSRKQEVSEIESARQRAMYLAFAENESGAVVADTSTAIEKSAAAITAAITQCVARRTARHLETVMAPAVNPQASRWLLFFCRHKVPLLSRMTRLLFNSDIYAPLPRDVLLPHPYGIIIHSKTVVGHRVTVMQQVTLGGKNAGENVAPTIEDGVYIGAGAKVLGDVHIGAGAIIGANAVITHDVPAHATVVGANRIVGRTADVTVIDEYFREDSTRDELPSDIAITRAELRPVDTTAMESLR